MLAALAGPGKKLAETVQQLLSEGHAGRGSDAILVGTRKPVLPTSPSVDTEPWAVLWL